MKSAKEILGDGRRGVGVRLESGLRVVPYANAVFIETGVGDERLVLVARAAKVLANIADRVGAKDLADALSEAVRTACAEGQCFSQSVRTR